MSKQKIDDNTYLHLCTDLQNAIYTQWSWLFIKANEYVKLMDAIDEAIFKSFEVKNDKQK